MKNSKKPMIISKFNFNNSIGYVYPDGTVSCGGIRQHLSFLKDSELKTKAVEAFKTLVNHNESI